MPWIIRSEKELLRSGSKIIQSIRIRNQIRVRTSLGNYIWLVRSSEQRIRYLGMPLTPLVNLGLFQGKIRIWRSYPKCIILEIKSSALQRKSHLCIPRKGIAWPKSHFPHLCLCERFIYSKIGPHIFLRQNRQTDPGNICFEFSVLCLCSVDTRERMRSRL